MRGLCAALRFNESGAEWACQPRSQQPFDSAGSIPNTDGQRIQHNSSYSVDKHFKIETLKAVKNVIKSLQIKKVAECPQKFPKRKLCSCYPILFLAVPHTKSKTAAIILWILHHRKDNKSPPWLRNPLKKADILRVGWGSLRAPRSFSLLFVFRHDPEGVWELGIARKKKIVLFWSSFWIPVPTPVSARELPLRKLKCPTPWYWPGVREV